MLWHLTEHLPSVVSALDDNVHGQRVRRWQPYQGWKGCIEKSRLAPGWSGGGLTRPGWRSGWYNDGFGLRLPGIQSKGEGLSDNIGASSGVCFGGGGWGGGAQGISMR